jgi:hypothetical protein
MTEKESDNTKKLSADWFMRGALSRLGETFDRFLGRNWAPSSSLATSELIERIKKVLDAEARDVPGKGKVVPHEIKLKVQWDKFATDEADIAEKLRDELLTATADHINDSLYYTVAPLSLAVEPDYFIEGVRLAAGFGQLAGAPASSDTNVTVTGLGAQLAGIDTVEAPPSSTLCYVAHFKLGEKEKEVPLGLIPGKSISVGRSGSNELIVDDNSVSKTHASVSLSEGGLLLADTGSTNGTFLNGERIAYGKAVKIDEADKITFGSIDVRFEKVDREPPEEGVPDAKPVAIDGLEFTSRTSTDEQEIKDRPPELKKEGTE